uniref:Uncharacterized protein n=1 Tax=Prolemur simus TaxID=1328070 RepID=A0A8C9AIG2_PROSS
MWGWTGGQQWAVESCQFWTHAVLHATDSGIHGLGCTQGRYLVEIGWRERAVMSSSHLSYLYLPLLAMILLGFHSGLQRC